LSEIELVNKFSIFINLIFKEAKEYLGELFDLIENVFELDLYHEALALKGQIDKFEKTGTIHSLTDMVFKTV